MATTMRLRAAVSSGHPFARWVPFVFALGVRCAIALAIIACATDVAPPSTPLITVDDFGDTLRLRGVPSRIVSLTPASTELLFALGAGDRVVGRTRWDVWPDEALSVPDVGDGIRPNIETVLGARPDLVLLYASESNRGAATALRAAGVQTLSLKVDMPSEFRHLTLTLGQVLHDTVIARVIADSVTASLNSVRERTRGANRVRVMWIADLEPLIVIGGGSFLSELIDLAGGANVFGDITDPSAPVSMETVLERAPDIVFGGRSIIEHVRAHSGWRELGAVKNDRVLEGDSYLMGRPSVRMGEAARKLALMLHPELFR